METLQPRTSATAAGLTEFTRSASCEAAGQQLAGSPHSTILLDGSISLGEDTETQSPFNDIAMQGDSIHNPIEIDDSKDGHIVQSVEPSYRLKRKRKITSLTHELISNMDNTYDDLREHCRFMDSRVRNLKMKLLISDHDKKDLRQQIENLRQLVEYLEQNIEDLEQENDELKTYKQLHPEVSEEHYGAAM